MRNVLASSPLSRSFISLFSSARMKAHSRAAPGARRATLSQPAASGSGRPGVAGRVARAADGTRAPLSPGPPPRPAAGVGRSSSSAQAAPAAAAAPGDAGASTASIQTLKSALLRAAAGTDRGKAADRNARVAVLEAVLALEAAAPARDAALDAAGLSGEWGLVFSGPGSREEAAAADTAAYEKRTGGLEGPVISFLAPVGRFFVKSTGTTQAIDAGSGSVHNIAAFRLFGGLDGELDVEGTVAPAPPGEVSPALAPTCGRARTDVAFTRMTLRLGGARLFSLPLTAFKPRGWIETTVLLDGDLRVSRGDKGSVFVAAKRARK